jgi:hypothetical protein
MEPREGLAEVSASDLEDLRVARALLENPSLTAQISAAVGTPIEKVLEHVPQKLRGRIEEITHQALLKALNAAVASLRNPGRQGSRDRLHKALAVGTGVGGGLFGTAALAVELPITTGVILRSIADVARSEGHDLSRLEVKLSCLEVFALGGTTARDDAVEGGYWVVRSAMAQQLRQAATYIAEQGLGGEGAPVVVRLIGRIAARYGTVVTEQAVAKAIPVVGAASGGLINYLFTSHFQSMARGHFIVKRLEDKYGTDLVRERYAALDAETSVAGRTGR